MVRAVTPIPFVKARFFDRCGKPLAGGKVYTYEANTTTPKVTYKDPYGLTPNTNPIILDAAGEADIYLDGTYRIRITDRNDVLVNDVEKIGSWFSDNLQDTLDNISGAMDDALKPILQNLENAINTAAAAGAGANGWTALLIKDASGKTQQEINNNQKLKNQDLVSVKDFNAKGDRTTNDSPTVQGYYNQQVEAGHATYMYFPTWKEEYLFESPIKMKNGGIKIFGFKGAGYNKYYFGQNKTLNRYGNIIVGGTHAFDLGDYRQSGEDNTLPVDGWTVEGLGFRQKTDSTTRSKDAIHITGLQDSPDRPIVFRDLTITEMNRGIYIPFVDTNVIVMAANLSVKDSNISGNNYGFLAEGRVYGASFSDVTIEQNKIGGIHGYFDSYLTIENSLVEGQPNSINLFQKIPFNRVIPHPQITIKNNYMEANSGDYCINYNYPEAIDARLEVVGNNGSVLDETVTDFLRIEGARYLELQYDCRKYPVTLMHNSALSPDSVLTNHSLPYFNIRKVGRQNGLSPSMGAIIFDKNYSNKQSSLEHTELTTASGVLKYTSTPHGSLSYVNQGEYLSASIPQINVGDIFAINALIKIDATNYIASEAANLNMIVINQDGNGFTEWQVDYAASKLVGGLMMVTLVGHATYAATQARFKLTGNNGKVVGKLFRANIRNYGQFVNDGSQKVRVYPHCPKLDNSELFSITANDVISLAAGAEVVQSFNATPAKLSDILVARYIGSANEGQYFSIKAECINALGSISIKFKNTSNSVLSLTAPKVQIKAIRM